MTDTYPDLPPGMWWEADHGLDMWGMEPWTSAGPVLDQGGRRWAYMPDRRAYHFATRCWARWHKHLDTCPDDGPKEKP